MPVSHGSCEYILQTQLKITNKKNIPKLFPGYDDKIFNRIRNKHLINMNAFARISHHVLFNILIKFPTD